MRASTWIFGPALAAACAVSQAQPPSQHTTLSGQLQTLDMKALASDSIDPKVSGMSVAQTVRRVSRASGMKRDQFETTSAFEARQEAAGGLAALESKGPVVFAVPVNRSNVTAAYDADSEELRFFVGSAPSSLSISQAFGKVDTVGIDGLQTKSAVYVGQNAFGAKAAVTQTGSTVYGVAFVIRPAFLKDNDFGRMPIATFKMTPAQAKKELPRLKAALAMEVAAPGYATSWDHKSATLSDPQDDTTRGAYLVGTFTGIVFYSGLTGKVLARVPEDFAKMGAAHSETTLN